MSNSVTIANPSVVLVPQSYLQSLIDENQSLKSELAILKGNHERLVQENENQKTMITELREENEHLKREIKELKRKNKKLERHVSSLLRDLSRREAIEKLHECDAFANKHFQQAYREEFKIDDYDKNIPTLGDFIRLPPSQTRHPDKYNFWIKFNESYPGSDRKDFHQIYREINKSRLDDAHPDVSDMTIEDFIKAVKIAFPEKYQTNKQQYDEYGEWLFSFPE